MSTSDLLWLIEDGIEIPEASRSRKLAKDLAEKLLGVDAGPSAPVLLMSRTSLTRIKPSGAIRVVLFPLPLVTEHLRIRKLIIPPGLGYQNELS